jgi:hypothetical protein
MHDITIDMHSTLDQKTVEAIITQFVEAHTGKTVSKIEATVNDNKFTGVNITYHSETPNISSINKIDKPKKPVIIDRTFKPMVYD